mmetsp:Transcript_109155/g.319494  ORF Transcript_109155/g.319494 Transcript_109155/m.319494 type:complete len:135 (+) Transcript_109155:51-455(+)
MRCILLSLGLLALAALAGAIDVVAEIQTFKDKCFETTSKEGGKAATVVKKRLVVWDPDTSCGEGKSFFHYAPTSGAFIPMTGGSGIRTYHAAVFDNYNEYGTWVGRCGKTPAGGSEGFSFRVANKDAGGACPGS